jgi:hypothetical protein
MAENDYMKGEKHLYVSSCEHRTVGDSAAK